MKKGKRKQDTQKPKSNLSLWDQKTVNIFTNALTEAQKKGISSTKQVEVDQYKSLIKAKAMRISGKFYDERNQNILAISQNKNRHNIPMYLTYNQLITFYKNNNEHFTKNHKDVTEALFKSKFKKVGNVIQEFMSYTHTYFKGKETSKTTDYISEMEYENATAGKSKEEIKKLGFGKRPVTRNKAVCSIECIYEYLPEEFIQKHFYLKEYRRLKAIKMDPKLHNQEVLDLAEEIKASCKASFLELDEDRSYYSPSNDQYVLAPYDKYKNPISYLNCATHEITHTSGYHTRLNRFKVDENLNLLPRSDVDYSAEEVTTEGGTLLTLASEGIYSSFDASVGYSNGWLKPILSNPKLCLKAFNDSVEASKYVRKDLYNYRIKIAQEQLNDFGIKLENIVEDGMTIETTFVSVKDKTNFVITTDQVEYTKFSPDKPELLESIADSAYFIDEPENRDEAIKKTLTKLIESKIALELIEGRKLTQKPKLELEEEPKQDKKLEKKSRSKLSM